MPFHIVMFILFAGSIALIGLCLAGYGSRDRSNEEHPWLPGHETQRRRAEWEQTHRDD